MAEHPQFRFRLLDRFDREAKAAGDLRLKRIALAKRAGAIARLSRFDEARKEIAALRACNVDYEPRLSAWILFAEGLVDHFQSLSLGAGDKFRRTLAIGLGTGDRDLIAAASAWLANSEFIRGNYLSAASHLSAAFQSAAPTDDASMARASLVVADALSWAGDSRTAVGWYQRARERAIQEGDIAMQSVILFNAAAFKVARLVEMDCLSSRSEHETRAAAMNLDSVANLDFGLGIQALGAMIPILRAEVKTVQRLWVDAIALFDAHAETAAREGQSRLLPKFLAERAYCKAQCGSDSEAMSEVLETVASLDQCSDLDDLFILHSRVSFTYRLLGEVAKADEHLEVSARCLASFKVQQQQMLDAILPVIRDLNV